MAAAAVAAAAAAAAAVGVVMWVVVGTVVELRECSSARCCSRRWKS